MKTKMPRKVKKYLTPRPFRVTAGIPFELLEKSSKRDMKALRARGGKILMMDRSPASLRRGTQSDAIFFSGVHEWRIPLDTIFAVAQHVDKTFQALTDGVSDIAKELEREGAWNGLINGSTKKGAKGKGVSRSRDNSSV